MIDTNRTSASRTLAKTAIGIWLVSLALPGFSVENGGDPFFGIFILLIGITLGWAVNGWAAYANIFFLFAAFNLLRKPASIPVASSIAMAALAATIPMFKGPILSEGSGAIVPVVSWGWGAILWMLSIAALATATTFRSGLLPEFTPKVIPFLLGSLLIAVGGYRLHQWGNASDQDREMYLPRSMAFSVADFCRVPVVWPTGPVVQSGEIIALDIDGPLRWDVTPYMPIKLPEFARYERLGYDWDTYPLADIPSMTVRSTPEPKKTLLQVKTTPDGGVIKIVNRATRMVLYEQPLRLVVAKDGRKRVCPLSGSDQWSGLSRGHYDALRVALGPIIKSSSSNASLGKLIDRPSQTKLLSEVAKPCGSGGMYFDSNNSEQDLDGRHVILHGDVRKLSPFCSSSYVGLAFVRSGQVGSPDRLNADVYLYDRTTLRPLASFSDRSGCLVTGECSGTVPPENIVELQIEEDKAIVNTVGGIAAVKRRF